MEVLLLKDVDRLGHSGECHCSRGRVPSQISATSSFGCDVINSESGLPLIEIGTLTVVFSG
jgi:hypothetical protein